MAFRKKNPLISENLGKIQGIHPNYTDAFQMYTELYGYNLVKCQDSNNMFELSYLITTYHSKPSFI